MDYNTTSTTTGTGNEKTLAVQIDDADGYHHHHHTHPSTTSSSGRSKAGITPMALIVTRNVQKFFANKILQQESKSKSNDGGSGTEENTNAMDVCAVLHDVDEILDHRSIEDGRLLLRGMVADLLKEIDLLRYKYDTLHTQYMNVKEERDVVNHIYNDKIDTLTMTLQTAMRSINNGKSTAKSDTDSLISAEWKQHMEDGNVVSADVATSLTIQTLMQKMEALHLTTLQQQDTIVQLHEQMEDLQCDNDAKTYKIMALEKQFTNINQKRTKVITKFGSTLSNNKTNGNNTNTSMILRPLRLNNIVDTTMTTATTPKSANKEVGVVQGEEEVVFQEKEDYDSIYQDHKDNIIANIFIKNQPIVVAPTTSIEEAATAVVVTDNDNHSVDPSTEMMTIDDNCVVVPEVDIEVANIDVAKPTVLEVDESQGRVVAVNDEVVPPVVASSVVTTVIDIPDDEVEDDKENVVPTVVVQQQQSPFAAIFQSQAKHSKTTAFDDDIQQATSTTTDLPPVMVTPPPLATKHRTLSKKTTTIRGDTSDRNMDQNSSSSNILKQSSSVVGKTKQRHGPRAPRLVQLVEQV